METTDTTKQDFAPMPEPELVLTSEAKYYLHTAGRWASFLGIMGFIGTGLIVLCAFFVGTIFAFISRYNPNATAMPAGVTGFLTFFYLLIALFYFFVSFYLYQFGTSIKDGTRFSDPLLATKAFKNLKSHLKLIGITTIVFISLYILIIICVIIAVIFAASTR